MLKGSARCEFVLRPLVESGLLAFPAESDGPCADLNFPSLQQLAFLDLPTGDWPVRWAVCRHLGPQNRAVERRGLKSWRHIAQEMVISRFS
jgi:hypothetical protein